MATHKPIDFTYSVIAMDEGNPMPFIQVRHNIEVAHRLYLLEGKCENIHGHSMWIELKIYATLNDTGIAGGLAFGDVKKVFREYLDGTFDHHLLLNEDDPWASRIYLYDFDPKDDSINGKQLPGLMAMPGDPTTENLAKWIAEWAKEQWMRPVSVLVHETNVNAAGYHLP